MQKKIDFGKMLAEYAIIVIFIVLFVVMSIFAPNFFTGNNMVNILRQVSISGICAVGMTFVMLTGGIDLSVGAILGVSGVLTAMMMLKGIPSLLASIIALALGVVIGGITGAIIHYIEIPPMIATLGTMTSLRGVAYLITGGYTGIWI